MENQAGKIVARNLVDLMCLWRMDFIDLASIIDVSGKTVASWYMRDVSADLTFEQLDQAAIFFGISVVCFFKPKFFNAHTLPDGLGYGIHGRIFTRPNESSQSRA